jgi:hypothetical protein
MKNHCAMGFAIYLMFHPLLPAKGETSHKKIGALCETADLFMLALTESAAGLLPCGLL